MVLPRLLSILTLFAFACQTNPMVCPTPEAVRLRKAKAHRMRYAAAKRKEALANNYDFFQKAETKSLNTIEEWDCPKPGLKHDRMVQKKAKDLQKRYAQNLKRVAKESEDRTITFGSSDGNR